MTSPRNRHIEKDNFGTRRHSDLIMEIVKVIDDYGSNPDKAVLIFEIKSSCHRERGKETPVQHIRHQADVAFSELRTVGQKVGRIRAIGPHCIYGGKEDGKAPAPRSLIGWHDVTHDEASHRDFFESVKLVAGLVDDYDGQG